MMSTLNTSRRVEEQTFSKAHMRGTGLNTSALLSLVTMHHILPILLVLRLTLLIKMVQDTDAILQLFLALSNVRTSIHTFASKSRALQQNYIAMSSELLSTHLVEIVKSYKDACPVHVHHVTATFLFWHTGCVCYSKL